MADKEVEAKDDKWVHRDIYEKLKAEHDLLNDLLKVIIQEYPEVKRMVKKALERFKKEEGL